MSDTTSKPSIVFVSGACHTEFHIKPVVPYFEKAGYRIIPQPLQSAGRPATFEDDVVPIQSSVDAELRAGRDVCLILHSGGGMSGCEAVNRLLAQRELAHDKQIRIMFLASMIDWSPVMEHFKSNNFIRWDLEKGQMSAPQPYYSFYSDMEPEQAQPFVDALTYQNSYMPEMSSQRWITVPLTYLVCERDVNVPPKYQRRFAHEYGIREVVIDGGHCPFISMPEKFVEIVDLAMKS